MDPWSYISPSSGDILNNVYDKEFSDSYFDVDHENTNGRGFGVQVFLVSLCIYFEQFWPLIFLVYVT